MAQFDVNSTSVENIISSIKAGEIARHPHWCVPGTWKQEILQN